MITQTFDLNMIPDSAPVVIHCDQYDHVEDRLIAKLFKGDVAYTPAAGATAIVQGRKPDGKGFTYSVSSISGNTVTFDLTEQMSAVAGRVKCQLVITENFDRTGTFAFDLDVQRSALPANTDMSTSEYEYVEELIETAESINIHPPIIGQNGNWYVWDTNTKAYVDSGIDASITVSVGNTTTLPAGSDATVTNTGTNTDPVLNFGIPKGEKGDTGNTGATGATPNITATASVDANTGTPSVSVTKTGTAENPSFAFGFSNLKGTKGDTGSTGATGQDGVSPAVTITPITGGHNVNITDKDHPTGQDFDVMDGATQDISGKADKVQNATSGHLASLDANGNLADSGKSASDFLTSVILPVNPSITPTESGAIWIETT